MNVTSSELQAGDQVHVSGHPLHWLPVSPHLARTLTVLSVAPRSVTLERADGMRGVFGAESAAALRAGVQTVHPWDVLAQQCSDVLRLVPGAVSPDHLALSVREPAHPDFLGVGALLPDGMAALNPALKGTVEGALRSWAEAQGWGWNLALEVSGRMGDRQ